MNWLLRFIGKTLVMRHASFFVDSSLPNLIFTVDLGCSTQMH
jgi:hypothetical protein